MSSSTDKPDGRRFRLLTESGNEQPLGTGTVLIFDVSEGRVYVRR